MERSWGDHDRSWDRLDDFGPPVGRFRALQQPILSIRSSILGSQRVGFGVSARYACDSASNIDFRMICFCLSFKLLHEARNVKLTFVDVPCSAAVRAQHMESSSRAGESLIFMFFHFQLSTGTFGSTWSVLGASCAQLGASWAPLGRLLVPTWALLGPT